MRPLCRPRLKGRCDEPADPLAHRRQQDLSRLPDPVQPLPERTHSHLHADGRPRRRLIITRSDSIAHQQLLNELSVYLLIIDDFLTVGIDSDAASDLFAGLPNREHRLPTQIASRPR